MVDWPGVLKFVTHGKPVQKLAQEFGWRPGARYTNLRDVRDVPFSGIGFLDIEWQNYDFERHLEVATATRPLLTVARDVESIRRLDKTLREAERLKQAANHVIIVPKDVRLSGRLSDLIPNEFLLGFSVPTRYGGTQIAPEEFRRPVHLLGGRPDTQRQLATLMPVVSVDCNRFTLDARFGDFFDGRRFRPHPKGGYHRCLRESVSNIEKLWTGYQPGLPRKAKKR